MMDRWGRRLVVWGAIFVCILATRGVLSIIHDGLSPDWIWP